jgi:hypothetical protein
VILQVLAVLGVAAGIISIAAAEPIGIGSRLEPMVDDYLIEQMDGAELRLHHPATREVVIDHNEPWEGNICCGHTVFQDGDLYRMYYRGRHHDFAQNKETHHFGCYAESKDGIHWVKPELGIVEFQGSKQNNIILAGQDKFNLAPFKDANPDCKPDEQYKALTNGHGGLDAYKSPDGIHWSPMVEGHVITKGAFDSLNLAFWDAVRGCYVDYHRGFRDGFRDIMTCTSDDFIHWTDPVWLKYTGAPREHLYTNGIKPYYRAPHILIGLPKRFVPDRRVVDHPHPGVSDAVFMTSRDGLSFHRWGEALIRPGLQEVRWVNRNNYPAWGIVTTKSDIPGAPDELSIYTTEGYYVGESTQLRRHTIRIDGFVSVNAPLAGGEMVTKPMVFDGKELVTNFSTSAAGSVRVEVQDGDGAPAEGFSLADCDEIFGDQLERVVTWAGTGDVGGLAGRPVRLRFALRDADLYSIQFRR